MALALEEILVQVSMSISLRKLLELYYFLPLSAGVFLSILW